MSISQPRHLLRLRYAKAAEAYLRSLPLEHFMEATPQATQREISVESFAVLRLYRPDVWYFNELLVQYPHGRGQAIHQVVPDNMVVLSTAEVQAEGSFDVPLQPVRPFWMLDYVSRRSERKDYEDNFTRYERHLKVPYYLVFYPDNQDLSLYRHNGKKFVTVRVNARGRYPIPRLDLELAIMDGWVRFWYQGQLLPLPAELQQQLDELRRRLQQAQEQAQQAQEQARQAQEQLQRERRHKERLLAQLRDLGIEPRGSSDNGDDH